MTAHTAVSIVEKSMPRDSETISCHFRYAGSGPKIAGTGTITFAPEGIAFDGKEVQRNSFRSLLRIVIMVPVVLLFIVPFVLLEMALGGGEGGISWGVKALLMGTLFGLMPVMFRWSAKLNPQEDGAQTTFFIPAEQVKGVAENFFQGTCSIHYKAPGNWMPTGISFMTEVPFATLKEQVDAYKSATT